MNIKYILLLFFALNFIPDIGRAKSVQNNAKSFYKLTSYDNLTNNLIDIRRIFQDDKGFVWLAGSNGFYRFDGYDVQYIPSRLSDGTKLYNRSVDYIKKDNSGNVWCIIDAHAHIFDTHKHQLYDVLAPLTAKTGKSYTVRKIKPLDDGTVWIICEGGIVVSAQEKSPLNTAKELFAIGHEIDGAEKEGNTVWVKTEKGDYVFRNGKVLATGQSYVKKTSPTPFHIDRFGRPWERADFAAPYISETKTVLKDMHDNVWYSFGRHLYRINFNDNLYSSLPSDTAIDRNCMVDRRGRLWVSHRSDKKVLIYNSENALEGYLAPDGSIRSTPVEFSSLVYVIYQERRGDIWLTTKPDGIYRLRERANGSYEVQHFSAENGLNDNEVIDVTEDKQGRLWFCGFHNGLNVIENPDADAPVIKAVPCTVEKMTTTLLKYRHIYITKDNTLLAATSAGLVVYDLRQGVAPLFKGRNVTLHSPDNNREDGLNSNEVKKIFQASDGTIYLCTMTGGINVLLSKDIYAKTLRFAHYDTSTGFPSDNIQSIIESDGRLWAVSQISLIEWNPKKSMPEGACVRLTLDDYDFEEGIPVRRADGTWVFGTSQGCRILNLKNIQQPKAVRPFNLVLTSVADSDTITLPSDTRSLSLNFATLDYRNPQNIQYAFCMMRKGKGEWQYIGKTHQISFQHLEPGEYVLMLRSTDSDGLWLRNTRSLLIQVTPTFWETWWAKLLYFVLFLIISAIAYYSWRYIKRIKQQQRETLDSYMLLLNHNEEEKKRRENHEEYRRQVIQKAKIEPYNDEFIKKVIEHVEKNISNADIDVDQLATEVCVSRSQLNHKLKQILGVTPSEMIREARIRHACNLLKDDALSINQIAFACGFSDPRYFSKCFKLSTGETPSNYRLKL